MVNCAVCKSTSKLHRCSGCHVVYYCSKEHQREDWKSHKIPCKAARAVGSQPGPSPAKAQDAAPVSKSPAPSSSSPPSHSPSPIALSSSSKVSLDLSAKPIDRGEEIGEIMDDHNRFEKALAASRKEQGPEHAETLQAAFDLINSNIGLYRLEACEKLLLEVFPTCERHHGSDWHAKAVQARAFLRYKQHRFEDALKDFILFKKIAGPSAELAENTGHVHNTLGHYVDAEACFTESLTLMEEPGAPAKSSSNKGGVLLGLGLVKDRLGRSNEGIELMNKALAFYRARFGGAPHSLIAKTLMSIANVHERRQHYDKAEKAFAEAMEIFQFTCGDDTPLTANAMHLLAKVQHALGKPEALPLILKSLSLYVSFDTLLVYMNIIVEILSTAKAWQIVASKSLPPSTSDAADSKKPASLARLHDLFAPFLPAIARCTARLSAERMDSAQEGTAAVFYKTGGEICMLAGDYQHARPLLERAIQLLNKVTDLDVSGLISECTGLLTFAGPSSAATKGKKAKKKK